MAAEFLRNIFSSTKNKKADDKREPFSIRVHHLTNYQELMMKKISPNDIVDNMIFDITFTAKEDKKVNEYLHDLIGETKEEREKFRNSMIKSYETFLSLPNNYPIEILEGKKDNICNSCTIGNHCTSPDALLGDFPYMERFIQFSKKKNTTITKSEVDITKEDKLIVRTAETTTKNVKKILKKHRFYNF